MHPPTNLRVLPRSEWARQGIGEQWRGVLVRFDGDDGNDYRLFARSARVHGHQPLVDLPHGATQYVPDPNGHIHPNRQLNADGTVNRVRFVRTPPRRTWTQIGGYEQGTGRSRTLANQPLHVVASEMPGDGPWQIMIDDRRDPYGRTHSNMVEWRLEAEHRESPEPPPAQVQDLLAGGEVRFSVPVTWGLAFGQFPGVAPARNYGMMGPRNLVLPTGEASEVTALFLMQPDILRLQLAHGTLAERFPTGVRVRHPDGNALFASPGARQTFSLGEARDYRRVEGTSEHIAVGARTDIELLW
ncbi:MAG: hypothetical protein OXC08_18895 [Thiotrichales bacterium]|nr:hypothetical protein [Thiotrichales bacterium]